MALRTVKSMFVPVSPSGTGKTLRSLMTDRYFLRKYVPAITKSENVFPSQLVIRTSQCYDVP